jgi:RNA polymerase sigma-70 factor (ECF subfamily)
VSDSGEHELFEQAKANNRTAFDRLQETLDASVRRFVRRLVGISEAEDDVVQDAFLALYMNLERLESSEHLRPFLFRVVRNLCYDTLRRQGRFQFVPLDAASEDSAVNPSFLTDRRRQPDEELHWILLHSEVQKAIDRLPEIQRQTIILYCEENLTYAQIAEAMGTDIGTVKSRIFYGRKNLRKLLKPEILEALGIKKEN